MSRSSAGAAPGRLTPHRLPQMKRASRSGAANVGGDATRMANAALDAREDVARFKSTLTASRPE